MIQYLTKLKMLIKSIPLGFKLVFATKLVVLVGFVWSKMKAMDSSKKQTILVIFVLIVGYGFIAFTISNTSNRLDEVVNNLKTIQVKQNMLIEEIENTANSINSEMNSLIEDLGQRVDKTQEDLGEVLEDLGFQRRTR